MNSRFKRSLLLWENLCTAQYKHFVNRQIKIGDHCLYIPGFGYFHKELIIYQDKNKTGGLKPNRSIFG
jgi:hypothetical protein